MTSNTQTHPLTDIWWNGQIHTMDDALSIAEAFGICNGRIACIGTNDAVLACAAPETKLHNLQKKCVFPGFIEGHIHLTLYGTSLLDLPLRDRTKQDILEDVRTAVSRLAPGEWLTGGMGWNNEIWDDPAYPTREELDAVSPHNPVLLPRMDGHLVWVNSAAFAACGITDDTPNPPHGEFMRTERGTLQGCASNAAAERLREAVPAPSTAQVQQALLAAQQQLLRMGITGVNDMSTAPVDAENLKALYESGAYKLRFHGALRSLPGEAEEARLAAYLEHCPEIGLYDDKFTIRACKILADGSMGAQSAALCEDYTDRPGHRGLLMQTDEAFFALVQDAARRGMQIITHAIGDAAIDQTLRVYEQALRQFPVADHRWHIEHFQLVTGTARERAKALGVVAGMQPMHAPNSASMALRRLGEQRAARAYAGGLVLETLGKVAWGSDAPVASPSPFSGMHAAITRTNDAHVPEGGFFPQNAVTPLEAVLGYTRWAAYAQFTENLRGTLECEKYADFVVLDSDLFALAQTNPHALPDISVLCTVIGGEIVFGSEPC